MNKNKGKILLSLLINLLFMQEISEGLILFTPFNITDETVTTYLVDENFNEINSWSHLYRAIPASMGYLMPDSTLWYPSQVQQPSMQSGGVGGRIQHLDWNNNILWEHTISDYNFQHHHDIEILPNGNILAIAWERKNLEEAQLMGREIIESPLQQMWSEVVFEIEPIGVDSAHIVWEWHLWDHLVQDHDPALPGYGVISNHPELMDINHGDVGGGGGPGGSSTYLTMAFRGSEVSATDPVVSTMGAFLGFVVGSVPASIENGYGSSYESYKILGNFIITGALLGSLFTSPKSRLLIRFNHTQFEYRVAYHE